MNREKDIEYTRYIAKIITDMAGRYSPYIIFGDWVKCAAIAIQNACCLLHDAVWQSREKEYIAIAEKYDREEIIKFSELLALVTDAMQTEIYDILGEVYMNLDMGSKQTGQFFTPFHISMLTAQMELTGISEESELIINEPSVGGGGMIIAVARVLKEKGIDYQKCMKVTAQDLDWRSVYMAYVQFSLLGIDAEVIQGNTLSESCISGKNPTDHVFLTPKRMGVLI